jgi:hypothetical protein
MITLPTFKLRNLDIVTCSWTYACRRHSDEWRNRQDHFKLFFSVMKSANCDVDIVILTDARQHTRRWAMRAAWYLLQLPQNVCTFRSFPHSSLYGSWTGRSLYYLIQAWIWNRRMMWEITKLATVAWGHAFLHSGVAVVWYNFLLFTSQSVMHIACCSRYEWRGWRCSGVLPSYHSAQ